MTLHQGNESCGLKKDLESHARFPTDQNSKKE